MLFQKTAGKSGARLASLPGPVAGPQPAAHRANGKHSGGLPAAQQRGNHKRGRHARLTHACAVGGRDLLVQRPITPTSSIMNNHAFCAHCSTQASTEPPRRVDSTEVCIRLVILEKNPDRSSLLSTRAVDWLDQKSQVVAVQGPVATPVQLPVIGHQQTGT